VGGTNAKEKRQNSADRQITKTRRRKEKKGGGGGSVAEASVGLRKFSGVGGD
jgi:hypothetical protein